MREYGVILKNKTVVVVGAAGLLGRAVVQKILVEGGRVVAADVDANKLNKAFDFPEYRCVECYVIDMADSGSIQKLFEYCDTEFGGIDGAVNAAYPRNKNYGRAVFDVAYNDFCENTALHLGGYFIFMQQCALYAKRSNKEFSLVNMSSIYGIVAPRFDIYQGTDMTTPVEYVGIKAGIQQLNKYFTNYMKGTKFRTNCVCLGGLLDGQADTFLERYKAYCNTKGMLMPEDVTGSVIFLLSDESMYIKGQNIIVDDGFVI